MPIHDYSTGKGKAVTRIVRPHNQVGHSYGGDKIKIDESEIKHPAVASALWTEDEHAEAQRKLEERRAEMFRVKPTPAQVAVNAQLAQAAERRKQDAEAARLAPSEK